MYIIASVSLATQTAAVISVHADELTARSAYLDHIGSLTNGRETYEAVHVSSNETRLYLRSSGWVYSTKTLAVVLQLVEIDAQLASD